MKKILGFLLAAAMVFAWGAVCAAQYDNYIPEHAHRYEAYAAKHKKLAYEDVLVAVNLKLDQRNYKDVVIADDPASTAVFVSKHYGLPKSYRPEHLVPVDETYAYRGVTLRQDCYAAFLSMVQDMEQEGLSLYIRSGYRVNRKRGGANSLWYAWPGHSEHQTGLAFDLCKKGVKYKILGEYKYHKTDEFAWLCNNAHRYGFILSYPKDRSDITGFGFEPWHWRYVGQDIAQDMRDKGFDTYHAYWATYLIQSPGQAQAPVPAQDKLKLGFGLTAAG